MQVIGFQQTFLFDEGEMSTVMLLKDKAGDVFQFPCTEEQAGILLSQVIGAEETTEDVSTDTVRASDVQASFFNTGQEDFGDEGVDFSSEFGEVGSI